MVEDRSFGAKLFSVFNYTFLFMIATLTMLPFLHVLASSFTTMEELARKSFILIPTEYSLDAYRYVFSTNTITKGLANSAFITIAGTFFSMLITSLMAYGLARKDLDFRRPIMFFVVFTLLFNGGLIPTFLVIKEVGLLDSYAALIIPVTVNAFNMIILKNFFGNLPEGLEESAKIDGCNDLSILFRIVLPLSLPALATISLFYAVTYWNNYFTAIMYLNDHTKWPVQVILRQIIIVASGLDGGEDFDESPPPAKTVKMAVIVVSTVPVLMVYPFLQKYFAKGALLGSVKG